MFDFVEIQNYSRICLYETPNSNLIWIRIVFTMFNSIMTIIMVALSTNFLQHSTRTPQKIQVDIKMKVLWCPFFVYRPVRHDRPYNTNFISNLFRRLDRHYDTNFDFLRCTTATQWLLQRQTIEAEKFSVVVRIFATWGCKEADIYGVAAPPVL